MKLCIFQLISIQEVNNVIEETSQEVVSNLPRVLRDIEVVKQEASILQDQMKAIKQDVEKVGGCNTDKYIAPDGRIVMLLYVYLNCSHSHP